ncbi:hypothetical protein D8674_013304 [Pyrus ussuriensis x Pyrus communis]|uniref:DDE Tnp4 domain-containing protein n=1 Tax=Pyrus ussuriensis x Pyrus communis TaxID=2448454 RepID=A0A5N5GPD2_9ROSA|nr:hypothetical protein D8674_013304 [Pyrus ussuriensis x Pyrus communis]
MVQGRRHYLGVEFRVWAWSFYIISQSSMEVEGGEEMEVDEVDEEMEVEQMVEEQIEEEEIDEEEIEEEELNETIKYLLMAIQAIVHMLKEFIITFGQPIEQMLATILLIVGHNSRYCLLRDTFGQSHWTTSRNFNKVLKALNTIALEMIAKHGLDCIRAIDGTHIPASMSGYNVTACNFDLEFMYVLSGWEGSAHDSRVLNDALTRRNGLKVPQEYSGSGHEPRNEKELFNLIHVVLACAVVHNFLHKECRSNEFPIEPDDESSSSPPLSVSEGDLDQDFQTQEQQRNIANEWRYNITLDMWRDAHNDNNVNGG